MTPAHKIEQFAVLSGRLSETTTRLADYELVLNGESVAEEVVEVLRSLERVLRDVINQVRVGGAASSQPLGAERAADLERRVGALETAIRGMKSHVHTVDVGRRS